MKNIYLHISCNKVEKSLFTLRDHFFPTKGLLYVMKSLRKFHTWNTVSLRWNYSTNFYYIAKNCDCTCLQNTHRRRMTVFRHLYFCINFNVKYICMLSFYVLWSWRCDMYPWSQRMIPCIFSSGKFLSPTWPFPRITSQWHERRKNITRLLICFAFRVEACENWFQQRKYGLGHNEWIQDNSAFFSCFNGLCVFQACTKLMSTGVLGL